MPEICVDNVILLYVDHNHKTNKVRKLLCNRCNYIAGAIEDARYEAVLQYLKEQN